MNVLVVIHYPFFGGPHNQVLRTVQPLAERGFTTRVVLPDEPGNAAERLRAAGCAVTLLELHRLRARPDLRLQARFIGGVPREVKELRRLIRDYAIDVVQVGGLVNPHAAIAARQEGAGVVWQLLDTRAPMALRMLLMPWVRTLGDVVMTTGVGVGRVHPGASSFGDRLIPFYPPVDTSLFRPDSNLRSAARTELGVVPGRWLIGTVANVTPQKGLEHFVAVADALHAIRSDVQFVILGSTMGTQLAYETKVRGLVRNSAAGKVGALSLVDPGMRVSDLLPAFDLFLLTSVPRSEGVSTTVLEAMSAGIPVVATDVGGLSEVVIDGVTGRIVAPLDDAAMVAAAGALLADSPEREEMGKASRRSAVDLYGVEACVEAHARAYQIASGRAACRRRGRIVGS